MNHTYCAWFCDHDGWWLQEFCGITAARRAVDCFNLTGYVLAEEPFKKEYV